MFLETFRWIKLCTCLKKLKKYEKNGEKVEMKRREALCSAKKDTTLEEKHKTLSY